MPPPPPPYLRTLPRRRSLVQTQTNLSLRRVIRSFLQQHHQIKTLLVFHHFHLRYVLADQARPILLSHRGSPISTSYLACAHSMRAWEVSISSVQCGPRSTSFGFPLPCEMSRKFLSFPLEKPTKRSRCHSLSAQSSRGCISLSSFLPLVSFGELEESKMTGKRGIFSAFQQTETV